MKKTTFPSLVAVFWFTVTLPFSSYGQEISAPVFKDGDWWKVKRETSLEGISRSGACQDMYDQYVVKIREGGTHVFTGTEQEIDCPQMAQSLLGIVPTTRDGQFRIPFPLKVGEPKSYRTDVGRPFHNVTVTAQSEKKMQILGREMTVYDIKLVATPLGNAGTTYDRSLLYSADCKCVLASDGVRTNKSLPRATDTERGALNFTISVKQSVIDFHVSP